MLPQVCRHARLVVVRGQKSYYLFIVHRSQDLWRNTSYVGNEIAVDYHFLFSDICVYCNLKIVVVVACLSLYVCVCVFM